MNADQFQTLLNSPEGSRSEFKEDDALWINQKRQ